MKIKRYKYPFLLIAGLAFFQYSCNKSLNLQPLDQLSDASYWQTPNDFMLAANQFYAYERKYDDVIFNNSTNFASFTPHSDYNSDIMGAPNSYSRGTNTIPTTDNYWNANYSTSTVNGVTATFATGAWSRIREINYLLSKAATYPNPADISRYVAESRFFRAYIYFDLLEIYGAVPIVTQPLATTSTQLVAPKSTRDSVVDFIIADLNAAIPNLPTAGALAASDLGRITQGAAQGFLSRVALYEGTWQEFRSNTTRANALLDMAVASSNAVITSAQYALFGTTAATSSLGDSAQKYMFILDNGKSNPANIQKSANTEYILANRFDQSLRETRQNIAHTCSGADLNRTFINMYLCKDGLPVEKSPLFQGYATMLSEYQNRDTRLNYNTKHAGGYYWSGNANWRVDWIGGPADIANADGSPFKPYNNGVSGYHNQKWVNEQQCADYVESYDYPVIRYAEILLNYAEAVFERNGSIGDADLNKSLNLVRLRVNKNNGMPALTNAFATANGLDMRTEIRRERTVELFLEGFRTDDLKRWHVATTVLAQPIVGIKWTGTEFQTTWASQATTAKDATGDLIIDNARSFAEKNYLLPIPSQQIQLNPSLIQNTGW